MPIFIVDHGTKLGPYETLELLGAGGMGEVYKARDTRLNRTVAIKVLPSALAAHPELRQRLEREARAVSSLNHPHICTLYDIGHQDGVDFLVLEYLEGETLANRLKKGALPLATALRYAIEIAEALHQAHRNGIVHRDLKPGNIMLTKAGTKLLDFGLAKLREATKTPVDDVTALLTRDLTSEGTIIGTIQYMAPEQLEGKEADARADIFAFGAVLYEMITGQKAFHGTSHASLIAEILKSEPAPISKVQPLTPAILDRVVTSCLAKDPEDRWQSAGDLARELKWMADPALQPESDKPRVSSAAASRAGVLWTVAVAAVLGMVSVSWLHFRERVPEQPSIRFTIPTEAVLPSQVRISPDSTRVAFVGMNAQGRRTLWIRQLDQPGALALPGTEGAMYPFWAPDSRQIAFFTSAKLKKIDSSGGQPQVICDAPYGLGGDWDRDGTILFSPDGNARSVIYRVTSNGGVPTPVMTSVGSAAGQSFPTFLPDGSHFLYLSRFTKFSPVAGETSAVRVGSLHSKESKPVVETGYSAVFWPGLKSPREIPPYLLFVRGGALMAQEMDAASFQLRGESFRILDSLATDGVYNFADFSVSENGTLAFNSAVYQHEAVWLDRSGKRLGAGTPVDRYAHPALTPDGKQAVFEVVDPKTADIGLWKLDVDRGEVALLKKSGVGPPVLFPDGGSVAFPCTVDGHQKFCRKAIGGAKSEEVFWESGESSAPIDISPDGRFMSYVKFGSRGFQIWILPLQGDQRPYRFDSSDSLQFNGLFSSDGKWIAYTTDETGDFEVYVQPFPATGEKSKVSSHGGGQPRWSRDGKELFYRTVDGKMMAVPLKTNSGFEAGVPRMLFQTSADPLFPNLGIPYAVTSDGQRFLVNVALDESRASPITIITNWRSGLRR